MATVDAVIAALDAFVPANDGSDDRRLYEIFEGFRRLQGRERAVPHMFALIERAGDADLGLPGPLVHELEAIPGYQSHLRESLRRNPTATTVWMINRILNSALSQHDRQSWLAQVTAVVEHMGVPQPIRAEAAEVLAYQQGRSRAV